MCYNKKLTKKEFYKLCYRMYFDLELREELFHLRQHFIKDKWPLNFAIQANELKLKQNELRVVLKLLGYKITKSKKYNNLVITL
jgi:hypothetical protein